jgi:putative transposase
LEQLLVKEYPTGRVVLVMDIASYHKSTSALASLSLCEHQLMVAWLPPYCSDLNPIERFWRQIKDRVCANKIQDTIDLVMLSAEQAWIEQIWAEQVSGFHVSKKLCQFT